MPKAKRASPAFGEHDYEIVYGKPLGRLNRSAEINIRGTHAQRLVVGDIFTFSRDHGLWDVIVAEVTSGAGGGWTARCRMLDVSPS